MAASTSGILRKPSIVEFLLKDGLISQDQHDRALQEHEATKRSFVRILADMGALSEDARLDLLSRQTGAKVVSLDKVVPNAEVATVLTRSICRKAGIVPLRMDESGAIILAMEDPSDVRTIADIEKLYNHPIKPVLARRKEILETIERMPEGVVLATEDETLGHRLMNHLTLTLLCFGPMAAFFYFIGYTNVGRDWYAGFQFEAFESILFFVVVWGSWAAMSYFINDLLFGKPKT